MVARAPFALAPAQRARPPLRRPVARVAALGAGPDSLLRDPRTLGHQFESLVVRDLRVHADALDASVLHCRDSTELEADAIVERRDGSWAAFEIKLGPGAVDEAARSLLRVAGRVDQARHGPPAALVFVTGWGFGYRRPRTRCTTVSVGPAHASGPGPPASRRGADDATPPGRPPP